MAKRKQIHTIDEYINQYPEEVRKILQVIRETIQAAATEARETISYQIPTFKYNGNLVHFAVYQHHIGLYPEPSAIQAFHSELSGYKVARGSVQFPLTKPIPLELITKMVQFGVKENQNKNKSKKAGEDL